MGTTQPIRKEDELYSFRMYYADEKPNVRNYTLIVLGLNTALRIGDLLSLKWSSVYNFQFQSFYDHILIHEQKTGKRNNVLLNATAKDALILFHVFYFGFFFCSVSGIFTVKQVYFASVTFTSRLPSAP